MKRSDTPQTLDPLSGLTARSVVVAAITLSFGITVFSLVYGWREVVSPAWSIVSVSAIAGSAVVLALASSPFRAPFGTGPHVVITAFLSLAIVAETIASYGADTVILDGYGYLVAALFLFPLGSYRPYPAIVTTTVVLSSTQIATAVIQAPFLTADYPVAVFAIVTAAPILASGAAAAALSGHLVRAERAQGLETIAADRSGAVLIQPLAIIDDEALPLLDRVTVARTVTAQDAEEARSVGSRLRELLVAESQSSLLPSWMGGIRDPHRHLAHWTMRQRAAMIAFAAKVIPPISHPEATLIVDEDARWTFAVTRHDGLTPGKATLAPYIATLGVAFDGVRLERLESTIVVRGRGPLQQ